MPVAPNLPTSGLVSGTTPGAIPNWHTANGVINSIYKTTIGGTRTAAFTLTQVMSGEFIPVNVATSVAVTVPPLEVGTSIELWAQGVGKFTLTSSGVGLQVPVGSTAAPRVQYSSISLLWVTSTTVYVSGDLV